MQANTAQMPPTEREPTPKASPKPDNEDSLTGIKKKEKAKRHFTDDEFEKGVQDRG
jgi:hypothetical protein